MLKLVLILYNFDSDGFSILVVDSIFFFAKLVLVNFSVFFCFSQTRFSLTGYLLILRRRPIRSLSNFVELSDGESPEESQIP